MTIYPPWDAYTMINACNECGNAIEECDCSDRDFRTDLFGSVEISEYKLESVRVEDGNLVIDISARAKGNIESVMVSGIITAFTPEEEDKLGRAAYEAYTRYYNRIGAPMDWDFLPTNVKAAWIATAVAVKGVDL